MRKSIREANVPTLQRLAKKYGFKVELIPDTFTRKDEQVRFEREWVVASVGYIEVDITGVFEPIDGWSFHTAIQHQKPFNLVMPRGAAEYREVDPHCDHCNTNRRRSMTYIIKDDSGNTRQIGKSCMTKYFGEATAASLLERANIAIQIDGMDDTMPKGWTPDFDTLQFIAAAYEMTLKHGYCPAASTDDTPTRQRALEHYRETKSLDKAQEIVNWVKSQTNMNDYMLNCHAVVHHDTINSRQMGLIASLPNSYLKAQSTPKETPTATVTEGRQEITGTITGFKVYTNEYGSTLKMTVLAPTGCRYFGTVPAALRGEAEIGDTITFKATVTPKDQHFGTFKRPTV